LKSVIPSNRANDQILLKAAHPFGNQAARSIIKYRPVILLPLAVKMAFKYLLENFLYFLFKVLSQPHALTSHTIT
jgi:hypothetical protein